MFIIYCYVYIYILICFWYRYNINIDMYIYIYIPCQTIPDHTVQYTIHTDIDTVQYIGDCFLQFHHPKNGCVIVVLPLETLEEPRPREVTC